LTLIPYESAFIRVLSGEVFMPDFPPSPPHYSALPVSRTASAQLR
jgi:hypothetical protein